MNQTKSNLLANASTLIAKNESSIIYNTNTTDIRFAMFAAILNITIAENHGYGDGTKLTYKLPFSVCAHITHCILFLTMY